MWMVGGVIGMAVMNSSVELCCSRQPSLVFFENLRLQKKSASCKR